MPAAPPAVVLMTATRLALLDAVAAGEVVFYQNVFNPCTMRQLPPDAPSPRRRNVTAKARECEQAGWIRVTRRATLTADGGRRYELTAAGRKARALAHLDQAQIQGEAAAAEATT